VQIFTQGLSMAFLYAISAPEREISRVNEGDRFKPDKGFNRGLTARA
jgi:hypothetical protein